MQEQPEWEAALRLALEDGGSGVIELSHPLNADQAERFAAIVGERAEAVQELNLSNSGGSDEDSTRTMLNAVAKCPNLNSIIIRYSAGKLLAPDSLVDVVYSALELTSVTCHRCKIGNKQATALVQAAAKHKQLKHLGIVLDGELDDESFVAIGEALYETSSLASISFARNEGVTMAGAASVMSAMLRNKLLRVVNLSGCGLDGSILPVAEAMGRFAADNIELHLAGAGAPDPDMFEMLCEGLAGDDKVTALDLSRTAIGDDGAVHLAAAMRANGVLREVQLQGCGVGARGAEAMLGALRSEGCKVRSLALRGNDDIPAELAAAIAEAAAKNGTK